MNACFNKHPGTLLPDGRVIVYTLEFTCASHAIKFLAPYPAGLDYMVIYNAMTEEIRLEEESESTFEFGPPMD